MIVFTLFNRIYLRHHLSSSPTVEKENERSQVLLTVDRNSVSLTLENLNVLPFPEKWLDCMLAFPFVSWLFKCISKFSRASRIDAWRIARQLIMTSTKVLFLFDILIFPLEKDIFFSSKSTGSFHLKDFEEKPWFLSMYVFLINKQTNKNMDYMFPFFSLSFALARARVRVLPKMR